ncbi:MAG TPA: SDR family NAD(P)-dependent oxidoreductase [Gammaproteobacteria bacterium]|nr:SDR family NAD(P)-dependent oxidoreductase [Gammaproteobacteria bacterium]
MGIDNGSKKDQAQSENDIAIIGMACRFPGNVNGPGEFWEFLMQGGDGIVPVPPDRWENAAWYDPDREKPGKLYVNRGGFIDWLRQFDPQFFGISPKEAPHIDPQHRWLLELTYEALENAGLKASELKGSDTAVFIGQFMHDYEQLQLDSASRKQMTSHTATGPSVTLTSNRISYAFDFTGPSVTLDTACSSSLVALDMACRALLNGDSGLAIAGGVNILLRPELTMSICKASMLSPDGRCKSFDAAANGYVRSEGAGVVLIKKLADARRDGDPILAVIKATGVNQDGQTVGITVPNGESQKKLLKQSLGRAGIAASEIQYAEAHGTGTAVGDPIEINALGALLGERVPGDMPCVIGSVKSNIGHMEATAGMAGLMKTVLAMDKGVIPQNIHYHTTNPAIDLAKLNVRIADQSLPWPDAPGRARKAIVNSFGFGGTNANVVLEQAPSRERAGTDQKPVVNHELKLLPISSKTEKGLKDQAAKYLRYLHNESAIDLHDICYTASLKREHHKYRLVVSGADREQMQGALENFMAGTPSAHYVQGPAQSGVDERITFVFSGMGPQWAGMGRELYRTERVFRAMMDRCSEALEPYAGWSLIDELFNARDSERIHATYIAQPAIFAIQVSLAELLKSWGIEPSCVVGHSAGEVGAAYVAGALDFEDAIKVIYHRSRLQHTTEGTGKMLAVGIGAEALKPYLAGLEAKVSIAAINSEQAITLAGDEAALQSIAQTLDEQGLFARFLNVGVPYHSPVMDRLKAPLIAELQDIRVHSPKIPLYSTVTALSTREGDWGPEYWADNVREPVLFKATIENIAGAGFTTFLEIAPHPVLSSSIEKNLEAIRKKGVTVATLKRNQNDVAMISQTLASLHISGFPLNWNVLYPKGGRLVLLPNYAWQHANYWHESEDTQKARLKNINQSGGFAEPVHPLLGSKLVSPSLIWQKTIDLQEQAYLAGHQVEGGAVYPGAAYLEMALAIAALQGQPGARTLENVEFKRAFFLDKDKPVVVDTAYDEQKGRFQIRAVEGGQWSVYSEGVVAGMARTAPTRRIRREELVKKLGMHYDKDAFYRHCHTLGLTYQGDFQPVTQAWYTNMESLVEIDVPSGIVATSNDYWLHPVIMDGAFQGLFPTINSGYLPVRIGELHYYKKPGARLYCYLKTLHKDAFHIKGDLTLFDEHGEILVEVLGCELKSLQTQSDSSGKHSLLYDFKWQPQPLREAEALESGQWIVLADSRGTGRKFAAQLERRAQSVCLIEVGAGVTTSADMAEAFKPYADSCRGVIYLWALDSEVSETLSADEMLASCQHTAITPLYLAQALDQVNWRHQQSVYLVTQAAHQLPGDAAPPRPAQGALWGFGRVFATEHPEHRMSLVDLGAEIDDSMIAQLADQVMSMDYEQEIALRTDGRHINRLRKLADAGLDGYIQSEIEITGDNAYQVVRQTKGTADGWRLQALSLPELAPGDIEVRVEYAGVCRQQVGECVGVITRIGKNVKGLSSGERVMGFARQSLSSVAHLNAASAVKLPENLSSAQAATVPAAFLSAHYSLSYLAGLQAGETVLIHEAADPVGLAAVQLALFRRARVFVTAATEVKRSYLRKLGLKNVYDSTTFEFAREMAAQLGGDGIDVALNVLSGQFVDKTLGLMSPFGRFVELCQGDIKLSGSQWELLIERNISYHCLNITDLVNRRDELSGRLLREIAQLLETHQLSSLPVTGFAAKAAADAMTALDDDSRVSKVVLEFTAPKVRVIQGLNTQVIRPRRSYLITGGLGGLGLEIMRWLAVQGAESIVLIGRSLPSANALLQIEDVRAKGVMVTTLQADVAEATDIIKVLRTIEEKLPALAGVIHSAGVLEDGTIAQQNADKYRKPLVPKVKGAWNLHRLTMHLELDLFVCFSSIASIIGWAGQSNYAAANTFMETLVNYRRAIGKPALSINWGPWDGSGMAANLEARDIQRMKDAGMTALSPEQGLAAMTKLLAYRVPQAGVFDLDWVLLARQYPEPLKRTLLLDFMKGPETGANEADFIEQLKSAPAAERESVLESKVSQLLADVLGLESAAAIDREVNVFEYGINSLMAMDFKNRLQGALKFKLPATLVSKYQTVRAMARHICESSLQEALAGSATVGDILLWDPQKPDAVAACEINGPLPFTPSVLLWFKQGKPKHFNTGFMAQFNAEKFDLGVLKTTLRILFTYHDGCRLRIFQDGPEYRQEIVSLGGEVPLAEHDLSGLGYEEGAARMQALNDQYQKSFTFTKDDPLFRMAYYRLDDAAHPHRLFLIFHHYVSDGMSQKLLVSDLKSVYLKVLEKQAVYFQPKRDSLISWNNRLHAFAHKEAVEQLPYWQSILEKSRLCRVPRDLKTNRVRKKRHYTIISKDLGREVYERLLELCAGQYFEVTDIGIWALIKVFSKLTLTESLWVDLVVHARAGVFDDVEIPNIFGQISESAPILFELEPGLGLFDQLNSIRQQRLRLPTGGMGLKALRYLNKDPAIQNSIGPDEAPQIVLNFNLADYGTAQEDDWVSPAKEGVGELDPNVVEDDFPREFYITGTLLEGGFSLIFWYHQENYYPGTVESLLDELSSMFLHIADSKTPVMAESEKVLNGN